MAKNFKIGQRYKIGDGKERGNIIEIIGVKIAPHSPVTMYYKNTNTGCESWFHEHSIYAERLTLIPNEKIVITTDGRTTTAKMYDGKQVVKTATAKCNPDDEFDFKKGAAIAFDRLVKEEPEKPKFKVGDFVKIKSVTRLHYFPIGAIVEIKEIDFEGDLHCYGCRDFTNGCKSFGTQIVSSVDVEVAE